MNPFAVITGGTDGIGREMIPALLAEGYKVLFVGRNADKGQAVLNAHAAHRDRMIFVQADLSLMQEVERVAEAVKQAATDGVRLLVHSAGVILTKRELTDEGLERTWAVDYLSRFHLTSLLSEKLEQGQPARVITIAASGTRKGRIHFADLDGPMNIGGMKGLGQAQFANDVFVVELARRLASKEIQCFAVHPGAVDTQIRREFPRWLTGIMGFFFRKSVLNAREGAEARSI